MNKVIAIDPGISKCGMVLADLERKRVEVAIVLKSNMLYDYVKKICKKEKVIEFLIGNGTSSEKHINVLNEFISSLIIVDEKNSTYKAKQRYFEIFPLAGIKAFLPREIFIINKNLDAISALLILEDYCKIKFTLDKNIDFKTWQK